MPQQRITAVPEIGHQLGFLNVVSGPYSVNTSKARYRAMECICTYQNCGNTVRVPVAEFRRNGVVSCGCARTARRFRHGHCGDPLYQVHFKMIDRCYNPNAEQFGNYGARGVAVCEEWLNETFGRQAFIDWAKPLYRNGLQIDRIDNEGSYNPKNCRFVEPHVNTNNRRITIRTASGESLAELWRERHHPDVRYGLAYLRFTRFGWDAEKAIMTPRRKTCAYE